MLDAAATPWKRKETITHSSWPMPEEMLAAPPRIDGSNGCLVSIIMVLWAAMGMKYRVPAARARTMINVPELVIVIPKPTRIYRAIAPIRIGFLRHICAHRTPPSSDPAMPNREFKLEMDVATVASMPRSSVRYVGRKDAIDVLAIAKVPAKSSSFQY